VTGLGYLTFLLGMLTVDPASFELTAPADSFGGVPAALTASGFLVISGGFVASVVSMVRRLRASTGEQRQQLRLIALSATLIAGGIVCLFVVQLLNDGEQTWAASMPLFISYFLLPILFATAVLRHRLYDLDLIINRTFVVVAGVAFAAVGYTVLVVLVGRQVEGRAGGFWVSLLATALVAVAFQPLRRSVVRLANRVAYGARAQPYEALSEFSRRLSEAPAPDTLLPAVAEAAGRAVSARGAVATLVVPGGDPVVGTWGDTQAAPDHVVPVRGEDRELGSLAVVRPRGTGARPADLRLLEALADQAAVAFRNTTLAGRLADHVARLDLTTRQLAGSRARLIEAGDAARRTLEAAIARDVLPSLTTLPDEIRRARAALADGTAGPDLTLLVDGTNHALEALRELTRGIFPTQLVRSGLEPALRSLLTRAESPATLTVEDTAGSRFSPRVEAAVYFCCAEAVRSGPGPTAIALSVDGDELVLRIGGVHGSAVDLPAVTDRVEAAGGRIAAYDGEVVLTVPVDAGLSSAEAGDAGRLVPEA
jgi:signal transduction histidine kinase